MYIYRNEKLKLSNLQKNKLMHRLNYSRCQEDLYLKLFNKIKSIYGGVHLYSENQDTSVYCQYW